MAAGDEMRASTSEQPIGGTGDATQNTDTADEEQVALADLFLYERTPVCMWRRLALCVYAPFGVVLLLLRVLLGVHVFAVSCLLRKASRVRCVVLRVMCTLLGIVVVESGVQETDSKMVVANHVCPLDHSVIDLVRPCVLPSVWDIPDLLMWCFGYADLGARQGRATLVQKAKKFVETSELPLLAFPEGAITSGRVGQLRFSTWPFDVVTTVQPVAIVVSRPWMCDVPPSVLGSRWWTDLLWLLFCPYTVFRLRWLPSVSKKEEESIADYTSRTEQLVATATGCRTTRHTSQDAVEFAKRRLLDEMRRLTENSRLMSVANGGFRTAGSAASQLDNAALRLKEMFPDVPVHAIRQDLERTRSPETTAAHLAEGQLAYQPEPLISVAKLESCPITVDPSLWRSVYEQRKWALVEENREKYLRRKTN